MSVPTVFGMRDQVTLIPFVRKSGAYGAEEFNTSNEVGPLRATIIQQTRQVGNSEGEIRISDKQVWVHSPGHEITTKDKIRLPDGSEPAVIALRSHKDIRGMVRMYEVFFGSSRRQR